MKKHTPILALLAALLWTSATGAETGAAPSVPEAGQATGEQVLEQAGAAETETAADTGLPLDDLQPAPSAMAQSAPHQAIHDLSPWGMYQAADWVVKSVMIGLLLASVLTWSVWVFKVVQLNIARRQAQQTLQTLVAADSLASAQRQCEGQLGAGMDLLAATGHELRLSAQGPASDEGIKERIGARLERVQIAAAAHMNQGTGVLATVGSVAPFVGLFGTVWGIMNSFIGIAQAQTTNLAVVAPGIAEALLATALGLVAAIPAVMIYNYLARAIGAYRTCLGDSATALLILVSRDLDRETAAGTPQQAAVSNAA